MDGATPSWLDDGPSSSSPPMGSPDPSPAPAPAAPASSDFAEPPGAFSIDETPPPSDKTAPAASNARNPAAAATDNVAGSILSGMNARSSRKAAAAAEAAAAEDEKELPRVILFMRLLNMAAAAFLITTSILQLIGIPHISVWVMAIYASCGGILVCCLETQLKFVRTIIALNFGFLFHSVYRFLFYILMASVTWSYGGLLAYITAITLGVVAVFNTYVLCRYPAYRRMREKIAAEEDKRIQAKINQQVRKQAVSQMGWGKN